MKKSTLPTEELEMLKRIYNVYSTRKEQILLSSKYNTKPGSHKLSKEKEHIIKLIDTSQLLIDFVINCNSEK